VKSPLLSEHAVFLLVQPALALTVLGKQARGVPASLAHLVIGHGLPRPGGNIVDIEEAQSSELHLSDL
jgi:hypothetical protein